jgi:hypothetical protein
MTTLAGKNISLLLPPDQNMLYFIKKGWILTRYIVTWGEILKGSEKAIGRQ